MLNPIMTFNSVTKSIFGSASRTSRISSQFIRHGSDSAAYAGDGKTTVKVLNDSEPGINLVNSYSAKGFRLSNNLFITGSILLFPTHAYSWAVKRGVDISLESLLVFDLIVPKPKIVVIGYGDPGEPHDLSIALHLKKKGISCEMLPTPNAVTTYNFLSYDAVHVAGAFIPVKQDVKMTQKDLKGLLEKDTIYADLGKFKDTVNHRYQVADDKLILKFREAERDKGKKKFDD